MWNAFERRMNRRPAPLISLVLPVKNAMPHVKKTIEALRRQTYRNFELLVQDGGSTDDTLEYLRSIRDLPHVDISSQPDRGVGQAYNRGIARSSGELLCLIAADEYLDDDALEKGVRWFRRFPRAAVVYGGVRLLNEKDQVKQIFIPPRFDLTRFVHNELFPTTAGFLNRERIGHDLYYDESLQTCPDYDFWIRLGSRFRPQELVVVREPILTVRGDRTSMSYRAESFDQFTRDKIFVLERYLRSLGDAAEVAKLRVTAKAGIFTWAAECVLELEGGSPRVLKWIGEAARLDPDSQRLAKLKKALEARKIDASSQPVAPTGPTVRVDGILQLDHCYAHPAWIGAKVHHGTPTRVTTMWGRWHYSAIIPLSWRERMNDRHWYWAKLSVTVLSGQVGIGLLASNNLLDERLVSAKDGRLDVFVKLSQSEAEGVMIRNGSLRRRAQVDIFSATIECTPKVES
jgi:glycosyltransferase involved in cell wall biosynthesis